MNGCGAQTLKTILICIRLCFPPTNCTHLFEYTQQNHYNKIPQCIIYKLSSFQCLGNVDELGSNPTLYDLNDSIEDTDASIESIHGECALIRLKNGGYAWGSQVSQTICRESVFHADSSLMNAVWCLFIFIATYSHI